jgi:vancomycin resistance protein VanJ
MVPHVFRRLSVARSALWFQILVLGLSAALCLATTMGYWFQPDSWAALLVCPRWLWFVLGLPLAILAFTRKRKIGSLAVAFLWLVYLFIFIEEISSLTRWRKWPSSEWQASRANGTAIRVVSLNTEGGNEDAAAEVASFEPDIVLFQESPVHTKLEALRAKLVGDTGELYKRPDVSILARGKIMPMPITEPWDIPFSHVKIELASGKSLEVIGVRLRPYDIAIDIWSPECWRKQHENRKMQRHQVEWLAQRIASVSDDAPLIVGGDFNMPGRDKMLNLLKPRLRDSFRQAGTGLGNTMANNIPILRIDKVWVSEHFRAASVIARRTIHSDHRMVVCDLILQ